MNILDVNNMKKEITINKEWLDKLVLIVDNLDRQTKLYSNNIEVDTRMSHLVGYVHSLDQFFKE